MRKLACSALLLALLLAGPVQARPSLLPEGSVVRTTCIACHSAEPGGALTRIESLRTTPEEWEAILGRMERRYGLALDAATRKQALQELSTHLGLARDEAARVSYMTRSPAASFKEMLPADDKVQRTCASCHSWGKVLSHRRSPESWKSLEGFHLASFPAATILSYEDMKWRLEARSMLDKIAAWLPFDSPSWRRDRQARKPDLSGRYLAAGRQIGHGFYQAIVTLEIRGKIADGEYAATREILWEDGKRERWSGAGVLYGNHALRLRWNWPGSHVKEALQVNPDGTLEGSWTVGHHEHVFGDEVLFPFGRGPWIAAVTPSWLVPGSLSRVRVLSTHKLGAVAFGPGTTVTASRPLADGWTEFTVRVPPDAVPGSGPVLLGGKPSRFALAIAPRVDYITVSPEHGVARTGYQWDPARPTRVPLQGVPFEALGWSIGRDGRRGTADDLNLGVLRGVDWSLEEFHTTPDDHDIDYIGTLLGTGLFLPAGFGPNPDSPSKNNTGNAWVVARWRPNPTADPLRARAYLWVTFPDMVKAVR